MTPREKQILTRLVEGMRLIRRDPMSSSFEFFDKLGQRIRTETIVTKALIFKMERSGLLKVGVPEGENTSRYLPTTIALAALESGKVLK